MTLYNRSLHSVSVVICLILSATLAGCRDENAKPEELPVASPQVTPADIYTGTDADGMAEMPPSGLTIPGADQTHEKEIEQLVKEDTITTEEIDAVFHFGFNKSTLTDDARIELKALVPQLKAMPGTIMIEGHADERGIPNYNKGLGMRRAQSVAAFFQEQGVAKKRMRLTSHGSERLLTRGNDEKSHAQNRRVELFLSSER
ncbi:OmpA family protein [Parendozoicomonas sp. Alg238-R29]|uniref:OmpA family protein n=1 Tax=Parendozoicomonas sp. Alg238-R29 TaxID=2993446 RepID=UPI00248E2686|nr:OmpA family protein [Parendozoicomonas sp. Alg238-R29]